MAEGKASEEWKHTSNVMALIANCNRDKNARAFEPNDFNPYAIKPKSKGVEIPIELLKSLWTSRFNSGE